MHSIRCYWIEYRISRVELYSKKYKNTKKQNREKTLWFWFSSAHIQKKNLLSQHRYVPSEMHQLNRFYIYFYFRSPYSHEKKPLLKNHSRISHMQRDIAPTMVEPEDAEAGRDRLRVRESRVVVAAQQEGIESSSGDNGIIELPQLNGGAEPETSAAATATSTANSTDTLIAVSGPVALPSSKQGANASAETAMGIGREFPQSSESAESLSRKRKQHSRHRRLRHTPSALKKAVNEVWATDAHKEAVVDHRLDSHTLQEKLDNSKRGTHPEIRSKLDPHLIDVVRTTHTHLLDDVHGDIMGGIIEERIARQRQMAVPKSSAPSLPPSPEPHSHSDLEAYADRMFNVAGVMMRDGAEDRNFISHKYDRRSLWFYDLQWSIRYRAVMILSHILLSGLVMLEVPAISSLATSSSATISVEFLCLAIQTLDIAVRVQSLRHPRSEKWLVLKGIVTALCIFDCLVQVGCTAGKDHCREFAFVVRVLRSLRVFFWVEYVPVLRNEFTQSIETVSRIVPALFLLVVIIMFYGGVGIALFPRGDLAASVGIDSTEGDLYFKDIQSAVFQLFYLFAGAVNFPDVSLPAIIQNAGTWWYQVVCVAYFLSFVTLSIFVLQNILIATVVEMHKDVRKKEIIQTYLRKHLAFAAAFEVIYAVQDLEQTRIRLLKAIEAEDLSALDNAIANARRLTSRIPIALPEKVPAMKLKSRLARERLYQGEPGTGQDDADVDGNEDGGFVCDNDQEEEEGREGKEEDESRSPTDDGEWSQQNRNDASNASQGHSEARASPKVAARPPRQPAADAAVKEPGSKSSENKKRDRARHRGSILLEDTSRTKAAGGSGTLLGRVDKDLDIESQRLLKRNFFRALSRLGDDVLSQNYAHPTHTEDAGLGGSSGALKGEEKDEGGQDAPGAENKTATLKPLPVYCANPEKMSDNNEIEIEMEGSSRFEEVWATLHRASKPSGESEKSEEHAETSIDVESFMMLPDVLLCEYGQRIRIQAGNDADAMDRFFNGGVRRDLRPIVASTWFSAVCLMAVIISFVMETMVISISSVGRAVYLSSKEGITFGFVAFTLVDFLLSLMFIGEMVIRILAIGWRGYWSSPWWRVDGIIAITTCIVVLVRLCTSLVFENGRGTVWIMLLCALRGVRIIKFMVTITSVRVILQTVAKVARHSSHFIGLLFALYYFFSIIGMHMVSMNLERTNLQVANTSWSTTAYQPSKPFDAAANFTLDAPLVYGYTEVVNFENFLSSMFTLIHITFLNNWHITCEAVMEAVVGQMPDGNLKSAVQILVFGYFFLVFILGWGLVMNVFISKFLEGYVFAKHVEDANERRRRLTTLTWTINSEGIGLNVTRVNPDKQLVMDGLREVFPTMHIGRSSSRDNGTSTGSSSVRADATTTATSKLACIACSYSNDNYHTLGCLGSLSDLQRCCQCRLMHRCELCLSPVCGKSSCSSRVIAPKLVLEVDRGIRSLQGAYNFFGAHFHGNHIWDPVRLCCHCMDDWQADIDSNEELFRGAELLHADNEAFADEVLGRNADASPRHIENTSLGLTSNPNDKDDGERSMQQRRKRRSSILTLLAGQSDLPIEETQ